MPEWELYLETLLWIRPQTRQRSAAISPGLQSDTHLKWFLYWDLRSTLTTKLHVLRSTLANELHGFRSTLTTELHGLRSTLTTELHVLRAILPTELHFEIYMVQPDWHVLRHKVGCVLCVLMLMRVLMFCDFCSRED